MNVENNKKVNEGEFGDYLVYEKQVSGNTNEKNKRCKKFCGNFNREVNFAHWASNKCKCFIIPGN